MAPMRILFTSYFCPPEVSAPASRVFDNAARLAAMGHEVTILTGLPNHPLGKVFGGYRWKPYQTETLGGVHVVRVGSWIAPNTTAVNRLKSYVSLMTAQVLGGLATGPADVVVGTSPPLFQALAGQLLASAKRCPFVFEVRDLWPENMVAVGAVRSGRGIRLLAAIERRLYTKAARMVVVTHGFRDYYRDKGVPEDRIEVVTNGVDLDEYRRVPYPESLARELGLEGKFVAGYLGTVGINHGLRTMIDAAEILKGHDDVRIVVVGDGAERAGLEAEARSRGLSNLLFLGERPRSAMPEFHALCDAVLILLKNAPYFHRVIPSKIFVCMGLERPILIGVDGEARRIVEAAGAGLFVEPENAAAVAAKILEMQAMKAEGRLELLGIAGRAHVERHYDRDRLAGSLERVLRDAVDQ